MKYCWQIEDIKKRLSESLQLSDPQAIARQKVYQEMLDDFYAEESVPDDKISKQRFMNIIENFDIGEHSNEMTDVALYLGSLFCDRELELPSTNLPVYPLENIIEKAKTFVRRQEYSSYFFTRKVCDSKGGRIHLKEIAPYSSFLGKCYIINKGEYYILVNSVNGVQDTVSLLHESSHIENHVKLADKVPMHMTELTSITREHYAFDFMTTYEDEKEVNKARAISISRYLAKAIRLSSIVSSVNELKINNNAEYIEAVYNHCTPEDINSVCNVLSRDFNTETDYICSLIASIDIYLNCKPKDAPFFVSMYQSGIRRINRKVVDRVAAYLNEYIFPTAKTKNK